MNEQLDPQSLKMIKFINNIPRLHPRKFCRYWFGLESFREDGRPRYREELILAMDYSELENKPRMRLHIPIKTSSEAYMVLSGYRIHLHENAIWKLNPADAVHGAINNGTNRIHLLLDCYINDNLKEMLASEKIEGARSDFCQVQMEVNASHPN